MNANAHRSQLLILFKLLLLLLEWLQVVKPCVEIGLHASQCITLLSIKVQMHAQQQQFVIINSNSIEIIKNMQLIDVWLVICMYACVISALHIELNLKQDNNLWRQLK